jgi:Holliday junction resolvase RusA-like endonuclease
MNIVIEGAPIAKKRPRFARRGQFVQTYNDQETEEGKWLLLAKGQVKDLFQGPLKVKMLFAMPRPKGHFGTGKNAAKLKPSAPQQHTKKPDLDNLVKFAKDCLNGVAWRDDSQVFELEARKIYGDRPRTEIIIEAA